MPHHPILDRFSANSARRETDGIGADMATFGHPTTSSTRERLLSKFGLGRSPSVTRVTTEDVEGDGAREDGHRSLLRNDFSFNPHQALMRSRRRSHGFPSTVISHAVRWYFRFQLSLRDIEELLFECGVTASWGSTWHLCQPKSAREAIARIRDGQDGRDDRGAVRLGGSSYVGYCRRTPVDLPAT
ncbi:UNVERIFIED_ORG: hypothetical protein ABIC54_005948 [Burkholderia sp. 1263]